MIKKSSNRSYLVFLKLAIFVLPAIFFIAGNAFAAEPPSPPGLLTASAVQAAIIKSMASIVSILSDKAISILGVFAVIQMVITNIGLLKSGADIEAVFGKLITSLLWVGFCIYVLENGPGFIDKVGQEFQNIPGVSLPNVGDILTSTAKLAGIASVAAILVGKVTDVGGLLLVYLILIVIFAGCFLAFKIFMLKLELGLIVMLAPLSFAMLSLNALKDQGIAPFKSLISLIYRTLLVGIIFSAFGELNKSFSEYISSVSSVSGFVAEGMGPVATNFISFIFAYLLFAYLLFKSDSIAATLASGSTNMGAADVAAAAATGAAAGAAAVATGNAGAALGRSLGEKMKGIPGSVSNASSRGGGVSTALDKPQIPAYQSQAPGGGGGGDDKKEFPTNSSGAPINPDRSGGNSSSNGSEDGDSPQSPPPTSPQAAAGEVGADANNSAAGASSSPSQNSTNFSSDSTQPKSLESASTSSKNPEPKPDSGISGGITGTAGDTDMNQTLSRLVSQLERQNAPRKPTAKESLGRLNDKVAQERATTSVSINANAHD